MTNFKYKSKAVLYYLPEADPSTLPITKIELFITIAEDFQPLSIIAKISAEFLDRILTTKDDYF